jgi:uncharacterized membrane protein YhaH (DUF805 family)
MQQAVWSVLSQYATFRGRARRSEYWYFFLVSSIVSVAATLIDMWLDNIVLEVVVTLATIVPSLSVGARRLHDIDRSGWWQLIGIVPVVGWIVIIVFFATDSGPRNQYGPNPKGAPGLDPFDVPSRV